MNNENETQDTEADWGEAMAEQAASEAQDEEKPSAAEAMAAEVIDDYAPADLENLEPERKGGGEVNLDSLVDIPVTLSMEIGRTRLSIRNLLQLNQGSVVELDRLAGEPIDVLVNGTLVAHGEVVVVNEKFAVRLTDVVSAQDRIKKLS